MPPIQSELVLVARRVRRFWVGVTLFWLVVCAVWFCWLQLPYPDSYERLDAWQLSDLFRADSIGETARTKFGNWLCNPHETFPEMRLPKINVPLTDLCFLDDNRGWVVGHDGLILHTENGGEAWQKQDFPEDEVRADLKAIHMLPDGTGWIVGDHGTVLKTTDGVKWAKIDPPVDGPLASVTSSLDGKSVWIGGNGIIFRNDDSVQSTSWKSHDLGAGIGPFNHIQIDNGHSGWASAFNDVFHTDNGDDWSITRTGLPKLPEVAAFKGSAGWLQAVETVDRNTEKLTIFTTNDDGASWAPLPNVESTFHRGDLLTSSVGSGKNEVWIFKSFGRISHMINGEPWKDQVCNNDYNPGIVYDVSTLDESGALMLLDHHGWAVFGSEIIHTENGDTWTRQSYPGIKGDNRMILAKEGYQAWSVINGTVIHTDDGGLTWHPQTGASNGFIEDLQMLDDCKRGWAACLNGQILHTEDGGITWSLVKSGTQPLDTIWISPNGLTGFAAKGIDIYDKTVDGQNWTGDEKVIPESRPLDMITMDGKSGWGIDNMHSTSKIGDKDTSIVYTVDGNNFKIIDIQPSLLKLEKESDKPSYDSVNFSELQISPDMLKGWALGHRSFVIFSRKSYIAGISNFIISSNKPSADWGNLWSDDTNTPALHGISMLPGKNNEWQNGWAVGNKGTLLQTGDSGKSWKPYQLVLPASQAAVRENLFQIKFFSDGQTGLISGENGLLLRTIDGERAGTELRFRISPIQHRPFISA